MDCGSQKSTGKPDIADINVKEHATSLEGECAERCHKGGGLGRVPTTARGVGMLGIRDGTDWNKPT
jgi:hypothetical protein